LKADIWFAKNRYKAESFSNVKKLVKLKNDQGKTISCVIPTLNEGDNVGSLIKKLKSKLMDNKSRRLIDEIIVVDSGSTDNTKEAAEKAGAQFMSAQKVMKKYGNKRGKGENLWKSLYVAKGDIIVWVDGDIKNMSPKFIYGLVGPLLTNKKLGYTKAFYQRPLRLGRELSPLGGGRVTELLIRPLFNMYFPKLAGFIQPLSGEYAGRRELLEKIPFFTGYGVETAMLIDIEKKFGLDVMAQVDLTKRIHRNQNLQSLSNMAFGILQVFARRANTLGKLIQVQKIKKTYKVIESKRDGRRITYSFRKKEITESQRPPIITVPEYRKKFKKDPTWYYA
ncbi:MAG: glucosyl-3-phosphoglycerate synthase, partial [archaeon]|nr:glucosyl-3-phosphoglycerate synthase [archaeon]